MLMTEEDGIQQLQDSISGREHWIIVGASEMSLAMMASIEEEFYGPDEESASQFTLLMVPGIPDQLMTGIALAHKSCMSPEQLGELGGFDVPENQDILLTPDLPMPVIDWLVEHFHSDDS